MMRLAILKQIVKMVCRMGDIVSLTDKEYIIRFALRTGDGELTNKLGDELIQPDADKEAVYRRFNMMADFKQDRISCIENLLVSIELYRVQEEKALKILAEVLSAYGIPLSEKEASKLSSEEIREYANRAETVPR